MTGDIGTSVVYDEADEFVYNVIIELYIAAKITGVKIFFRARKYVQVELTKGQ